MDRGGLEMATRGVHFAITAEQMKELLEADEDGTIQEIIEEIEEAWDTDYLAESDKAWDAMHRILTDGQLEFGDPDQPLSLCVLGPRQLHEDDDYIVSLVLPAEVPAVAKALEGVSEEWFRQQYETVVPKDYAPEYGPEDLAYTWSNFQDVRKLFQKAAKSKRAVVFTTAQ
jgi:hypothetical protein